MTRVMLAIFPILTFLLLPQICLAAPPPKAPPLPAVSTISPTTSFAGPQSIVLGGKNFINVKSVNIYQAIKTRDGLPVLSCLYTVDSVSQITARVTLTAGSYYFRVTTSYGTINSPILKVTNPPPVISSISPTTNLAGAFNVLISGSNFANVQAVGAYDAGSGNLIANTTYAVNSASQITASVNLAAGSYYLRVTTGSGSSENSPPLTVTAPAPAPTPTPKPLTLAPGPYQVEDLGSVVQSATLEKTYAVTLPQTNEMHLLLYYVLKQYGTAPFQILDVDLASGHAEVMDAVIGRPGANASVLHSNGKIYVGSGDPGYFMVYDPMTGQTQQLAKLADKGAQFAIEGDDGAIYIGECVKGYVERYDPHSGAWENYGIIDDPGPPYYRYAYTLGSDGRYVYIGIGQMPWYLVVYDRVTRTQTVYWKDQQLLYCGISKGLDGAWYARASWPVTGSRWFKLNGSNPPEALPQGQAPTLDPKRNPLSSLGDGIPSSFEYNLDLADACPDTGNAGRATVKWQKKTESTWHQATTQLRIGPFDVKRLYADNQGLFGFTSFYGPAFYYEPLTKTTSILGRPQRSLYDALYDNLAGKYYLAGYPAATMEYDPFRDWTLTSSVPNLNDPSLNPKFLSLPPAGTAKYHYYLAKGTDGSIYVGEHHERDSVGGSLGWYNPVTGQTGGLRDPFLQYDARDLIAAGNRLVFSSVSIQSGIDGKLFVFDTDEKKIINSFVPLPGERETGKLLVPDNNPNTILGVINGVSNSRVYAADLKTGGLLYARDLPAAAFGGIISYDRRLVKGPDGYAWLYLGNAIYRIDPASGTPEKIIDASPAGNLVFFHNELYIYGNGQDNIRRVSGLFAGN